MALNAHLPRDVRIVEAAETDPDFHARFRAMRRAYRYLIVSRPTALLSRRAWARPIRADLEALRRASRPLEGSHDFLTFSKQGGDTGDTRCEVTELRWSRRGIVTRFDIVADRFLYTMVRRIVSTVLHAAEEGGGGKAVRAALHARSEARHAARARSWLVPHGGPLSPAGMASQGASGCLWLKVPLPR